ncbi:hypothetical protein KCP76_25425 [Salmonella enterica subsp. enterica serovar Weltevreden]|nr:hypothetical protein KCP76_25425 [Salmonella enterica subsp. enterica serovar Weltevreden]
MRVASLSTPASRARAGFVRFIGKNFVFDERMGERISMRLSRIAISAARPSAIAIPTAKNDGCHLPFIQCPQCASKFNGCCSEQCCEELAFAGGRTAPDVAGRARTANKIL